MKFKKLISGFLAVAIMATSLMPATVFAATNKDEAIAEINGIVTTTAADPSYADVATSVTTLDALVATYEGFDAATQAEIDTATGGKEAGIDYVEALSVSLRVNQAKGWTVASPEVGKVSEGITAMKAIMDSYNNLTVNQKTTVDGQTTFGMNGINTLYVSLRVEKFKGSSVDTVNVDTINKVIAEFNALTDEQKTAVNAQTANGIDALIALPIAVKLKAAQSYTLASPEATTDGLNALISEYTALTDAQRATVDAQVPNSLNALNALKMAISFNEIPDGLTAGGIKSDAAMLQTVRDLNNAYASLSDEAKALVSGYLPAGKVTYVTGLNSEPYTFGTATKDYADFGPVTFVWGTGSDEIKIEANSATRTYGEDYIPNGITVTASGIQESDRAAFEAWFLGGMGGNHTLTLNVAGAEGRTQDGTTDAGTYSVVVESSLPGNSIVFPEVGGKVYRVSSTGTGKIIVDERPITIQAEDKTKAFGDSDPSFTYEVVSGSMVNGDQLLAGADGRKLYRLHNGDSTEQVGKYDILNNLTHPNYDITFQAGGQLEIQKATVTVSAGFEDPATGNFLDAYTREYGDATPVLTYKVTGLKGDDVFGDPTNPNNLGTISVDTSVTSTSPVSPTTYPVLATVNLDSATEAATNNNYNFVTISGDLTIAPREILIDIAGAEKEFGQTDPAFTTTITAPNATDKTAPEKAHDGQDLAPLAGSVTREAGEDVGTYRFLNDYVVGGTPAVYTLNMPVTDIDAGTDVVIGSKTITLTTTTIAEQLAEIEKAVNRDVAFPFVAKINGTNITLTAAANGSVAIAPTFTYVMGGTSTTGNVATISTGSDAANTVNPNYNIKVQSGKFTITPVALTITVKDSTRQFGDANPAFEVTYEGLMNGETPENNSLTGTLSFNTTADEKSDKGDYPVSASGLSGANYEITYVDGTLKITERLVTVSFKDAAKLYGTKTEIPELMFDGMMFGDKPLELSQATVFSLATQSAMQTRAPVAIPGITVDVSDEVAGINGYVGPAAGETKTYENAFTSQAIISGNYSYQIGAGSLEVSRLTSNTGMFSVSGGVKSTNVYNTPVTVTAANGYKISYSDALTGNTWSDSLTVSGDGAKDVKFYLMRLEDGAITSGANQAFTIDTYVAPAVVVNNPLTGMDFATYILPLIGVIIVLLLLVVAIVIKNKKAKVAVSKTTEEKNSDTPANDIVDVEATEVIESKDDTPASDNDDDVELD